MVSNSSCSLGPSGLSPSHTNQRPSSGPFTASLGAPLIYESFPKENMPPQQVLMQTYRTGLVYVSSNYALGGGVARRVGVMSDEIKRM